MENVNYKFRYVKIQIYAILFREYSFSSIAFPKIRRKILGFVQERKDIKRK
jgi:hypothetical protein